MTVPTLFSSHARTLRGASYIATEADAQSDGAQSGVAEVAVSNAIDIASLLLSAAVAAVIGFVVAAFVSALLGRTFRRWQVGAALVKRIRTPLYVTAMVWGAWIGLDWRLQEADLTKWSNGALVSSALHGLLILAIVAMTWILYSAAWVFEDAARLRNRADQGRSRRFATQAQVLRRLTQVLVVIVGICVILGTFAAARQAMGTLLASAGLMSVIAGLAAQQTLGNVFAGIQLAFTDAIRVGDVVVANAKGESGAIEEITLSYVVVRVWDERRLIIPSTYFTSTTFENWTRRAAAQLGTVEVQLDWSAPMALIRQKVEQILTSTDLWDGRTWNVQMTASDTSTVTIRILVSAENSGNLWDLRCHLRERLIEWIVAEEPWTRPSTRIQTYQGTPVAHDTSRAQVAAFAAELRSIAGDTSVPLGHESGNTAIEDARHALEGEDAGIDAEHAARMVAARRKAKRARRRAMADRIRDLAEAGDRGEASPRDDSSTQVMTRGTLQKVLEAVAKGVQPGAEESSSPVPGTQGVTDTGAISARELSEKNGSASTSEQAATSSQGKNISSESKESESKEPDAITMTLTTSGKGERLFSGSPDAEERSAIFAGPGEDALAEREATRQRREREQETREQEAMSATGSFPAIVCDGEESGDGHDEDLTETKIQHL